MWWFGLTVLCVCANASLLDYIWVDKKAEHANELDSFPQVPYEVTDKDNRFLEEASKLVGINLSNLDLCHHRVVLTLKKSCNELNSEQIGKLAVMLLNCQSGAEGRKLFDCTEEMSLKQCTSKMDPDTWNAYHLVTNRAKAVCASVRQEQFRGLTELTVNKLMNTAHEQIQMMNKLNNEQKHLHDFTHEAMNDLSNKNSKLLNQQNDLLHFSDIHRHKIEENFQELVKERGLIRSGQQQVAVLVGDLRGKLDEGLKQLELQSKRSKLNHASLLNDLDHLHVSTDEVSTKIEKTADHIVLSLEQLQKINETIFGLTKMMSDLQLSFDGKLTWISTRVGNNDDVLNQMYIILTHVVYLLIGMLCLAFINADKFTRLFFLLSVPSNLAANLYKWHGQNIATLSAIVLSVFGAHWIANAIMRYKARQEVQSKQEPKKLVSKENINEVKRQPKVPVIPQHLSPVRESYVDDTDNEEIMGFSRNSLNMSQTSERATTPAWQTTRFLTPIPPRLLNESFGSDSGRSGTPFTSSLIGRVQCAGITQKGTQCRNAAVAGETTCRIHNRQSTR